MSSDEIRAMCAEYRRCDRSRSDSEVKSQEISFLLLWVQHQIWVNVSVKVFLTQCF